MTTPSQPAALTVKDHKFLSYLEQRYLESGSIPTKDVCVSSGYTDSGHYNKCLKSQDFRHAMLTRGMSLRGFSETPELDGILSEEQLIAANVMLDLRDNRSQSKKLRELGVSTAKWEGWLRDPAFQNYLRTRSEALLPDNLHESHLALLDRVRSGDMVAIKYYNEITGRYVPNGNDKADVNAVLMMVMEVLQRRVKDPELVTAICDDLIAIGRANAPVQQAPVAISARPLASITVVGGDPDGLL